MTSFQREASAGPALGRRTLLKGLIGVGGAAALPSLAACSSARPAAADTVTFGSNAWVPEPKGAYENVFAAAREATGVEIDVTWVEHNAFQQDITSYLRGDPQDVFTWFAGERMQFFADQGLAGQADEVWQKIGGSYTDAMRAQSKGADGHYYFVPFVYYPWAVFYSRSLWQSRGYSAPATWDEFIALAGAMKGDGLVPIAFANKDGWPAMGTFDYLNMRMNGFAFHIDLMRGGKGWDSPQVAAVFDQWRRLLPYYPPGFADRAWQEGAAQVAGKQAGMTVLGLDQIGTAFTGEHAGDLGFFAFPSMDPLYGQDAVEAPIDGFMLSRAPKNPSGASRLLEYLGTAAAQQLWLGSNPADIATAGGVDTAGYTPAQNAAARLITDAKQISQFMDRDTRPDFAGPVMLPAIRAFLADPASARPILADAAAQARRIWTAA